MEMNPKSTSAPPPTPPIPTSPTIPPPDPTAGNTLAAPQLTETGPGFSRNILLLYRKERRGFLWKNKPGLRITEESCIITTAEEDPSVGPLLNAVTTDMNEEKILHNYEFVRSWQTQSIPRFYCVLLSQMKPIILPVQAPPAPTPPPDTSMTQKKAVIEAEPVSPILPLSLTLTLPQDCMGVQRSRSPSPVSSLGYDIIRTPPLNSRQSGSSRFGTFQSNDLFC
ncbi:hypothetical protein N7478_005193 [Penicillium angulare]|uniref:uncharacterized protein n=1 Tax=Penicillium angulare TaxID=116970 RepID=UPI0025408CED|nr:uncharacterized protein N7478_005193 [Penicillium angulare]KAJ5279821.1 hypothetical protein N7478_005193 [Penicillium angulare]